MINLKSLPSTDSTMTEDLSTDASLLSQDYFPPGDLPSLDDNLLHALDYYYYYYYYYYGKESQSQI